MEVKQIIVVNTALNMPPGKLAAQVAHASLGCILNHKEITDTGIDISFEKGSCFDIWINGVFTKVVLKVKSEEKLLKVYQSALDNGLNAVLIKDSARTFFDKPTFTCVGIGPDYQENLDKVTKRLQVL